MHEDIAYVGRVTMMDEPLTSQRVGPKLVAHTKMSRCVCAGSPVATVAVAVVTAIDAIPFNNPRVCTRLPLTANDGTLNAPPYATTGAVSGSALNPTVVAKYSKPESETHAGPVAVAVTPLTVTRPPATRTSSHLRALLEAAL